MSIAYVTYSGGDGARQNVTWVATAGTKQELIDEIEAVLLAAGWSTISGSGTTSLCMQSAATPQNLQMRLWVKGINTNCVSLSISNVAGSKVASNGTNNGGMLLPVASKQWRFVGNKYQMAIFNPIATPARGFAMFGVPYLSSPLSGVITEDIWLQCNAMNDTDSTVRNSFRIALATVVPGSNSANHQVICNGNMWEHGNGSQNQNACGFLLIPSLFAYQNTTLEGYCYHDDSAYIVDPLLCWGLTGPGDVAKCRGQMWDAVISTAPYTGDLTTSFDGHDWVVLTDNNYGGNSQPRGTILLATS